MRPWTAGAKNMGPAPKVSACFRQLTDVLSALPGVTVQPSGPLAAELKLEGHPPLDRVTLELRCKNRFWSQEYDPVYLCRTAWSGQVSGCLRLGKGPTPGQLTPKTPVLEPLARHLAGNPMLTERLKKPDLVELEIQLGSGEAVLRAVPITGGITRMLLPPLTHWISPTPRECASLLQLLQLLLAELGRSDTVE